MTALPDVALDAGIEDDVADILRADHWMTAIEVHRQCFRRWSQKAVRICLRDMHESSLVEGRIGGPGDRPVREYRAWK